MDEASIAERRQDRWDALAAIVLALAAVLSAWAAYQSTRWSGEQANAYAESAALRAAAGQHGTAASRQIQIDVSTFLGWSEAVAAGDAARATFIRERMRTEFQPAFDAWLATAPDPATPPKDTPFTRPEYVLAEQTQADALNAAADERLADAQEHNQIADDFVLVAVVFASVLFVAGIASRFRQARIRGGLSLLAAGLFCAGVVLEFLLPQNL
ncbi:MAG: hypothetical protein U0869_05515 [Chloroflexota bacterium]